MIARIREHNKTDRRLPIRFVMLFIVVRSDRIRLLVVSVLSVLSVVSALSVYGS